MFFFERGNLKCTRGKLWGQFKAVFEAVIREVWKSRCASACHEESFVCMLGAYSRPQGKKPIGILFIDGGEKSRCQLNEYSDGSRALRGHGAAPIFYQSSSQRSRNLFTAIQIFLCIAEFFPPFSFLPPLVSPYAVHAVELPRCSSSSASLPPSRGPCILPRRGIMRASSDGWPRASHCIGALWLIELAKWKMKCQRGHAAQRGLLVFVWVRNRDEHTWSTSWLLPGPCSRQSARRAAVAQRKKMILIDLPDSIGVQSVDLEGNKKKKKCSSAPFPRTSIITDGWAIWALTRTKEDRTCQKKKKGGWWKATPRQGRVPVCYVVILTLSLSLSWLKVSELSRRLTPSAKKGWRWNEATAQDITQSVSCLQEAKCQPRAPLGTPESKHSNFTWSVLKELFGSNLQAHMMVPLRAIKIL